MHRLRKIGIIGGGFSGTLTAVHLIEKTVKPIEIFIINKKSTVTKGVAYTTYSEKHLLNVVALKMSAFTHQPTHFLDWAMKQPEFKNEDREIIATSFLSRNTYSKYLTEIWNRAIVTAREKNVKIELIDNDATDLELSNTKAKILLANNHSLRVDDCIIATGNQLPRNPLIKNNSFFQHPNYFQNPWTAAAVNNPDNRIAILLIGNGLTMVDTVLGLLEQGYKGTIYSISPNGFNVLPHRDFNFHYEKINEDLKVPRISLFELVKLTNKHIKSLKTLGISAEPVIDALRPHVQRIWGNLSPHERAVFMSRLRHLWGVARHRIPLTIHDQIQQLRIEGQLRIKSGKITDFTETENGIKVDYFDKKDLKEKVILVGRIINCTGPETDIEKLSTPFLKNCLLKGIINQDSLKLGINANTETYQTINNQEYTHENIYTIGSNLKGMLWESTAVNELRFQSEKLAEELVNKYNLTY